MVDRDLRMLHSFNFLDRINRIYWTLILAFRMKAKKLNRLRRMNKITAIEFLFDYKDEILKGNIVYVFPARRAGLGFATFFPARLAWAARNGGPVESGEEKKS